MHIALPLLLAVLVLAPTLWVHWQLARHKAERPDLPGTGGELARHLLDRLGLHDVTVETTGPGQDHYDPGDRAVRLSPDLHDGRSISAVAVAAHEVGHAMQHRDDYGPLLQRQRLIDSTRWALLVARIVLGLAPFAMMLHSPRLGLLILVVGALAMAVKVVVHLATLPVELDASFARAMPILETGYLDEHDLPAARSVLRAAAFTYVAGALISMLNVLRWVRGGR